MDLQHPLAIMGRTIIFQWRIVSLDKCGGLAGFPSISWPNTLWKCEHYQFFRHLYTYLNELFLSFVIIPCHFPENLRYGAAWNIQFFSVIVQCTDDFPLRVSLDRFCFPFFPWINGWFAGERLRTWTSAAFSCVHFLDRGRQWCSGGGACFFFQAVNKRCASSTQKWLRH